MKSLLNTGFALFSAALIVISYGLARFAFGLFVPPLSGPSWDMSRVSQAPAPSNMAPPYNMLSAGTSLKIKKPHIVATAGETIISISE